MKKKLKKLTTNLRIFSVFGEVELDHGKKR